MNRQSVRVGFNCPPDFRTQHSYFDTVVVLTGFVQVKVRRIKGLKTRLDGKSSLPVSIFLHDLVESGNTIPVLTFTSGRCRPIRLLSLLGYDTRLCWG